MTKPIDQLMPQTAAEKQLAMEKRLCLVCGEPALPKCPSDAGMREYTISGTCEECFDKMFAEEEEEDEDGGLE